MLQILSIPCLTETIRALIFVETETMIMIFLKNELFLILQNNTDVNVKPKCNSSYTGPLTEAEPCLELWFVQVQVDVHVSLLQNLILQGKY